MPDLQAPAHYSRAKSVAPDHLDGFFKWIPHDCYVEFTSNVECPIGWVGLVKVDDALIDLFHREGWFDSRIPTHGWYNVRINEAGFVFAMYYGFDATLPEEQARADFAEANEAFNIWEGWTDDPITDYDENGNPLNPAEYCPVCGQPDNCGDCTHQPPL